MAGPLVTWRRTPSSLAITWASVVLPRPGGPANRKWSSAHPPRRAAATATLRLSTTSRCPTYSSNRCGRSATSISRSPARSSGVTSLSTRASSCRFLMVSPRHRSQRLPQEALEGRVGAERQGRDRLVHLGRPPAELAERAGHIVDQRWAHAHRAAPLRAYRRTGAGRRRRLAPAEEQLLAALAQLDHQELGGLLA